MSIVGSMVCGLDQWQQMLRAPVRECLRKVYAAHVDQVRLIDGAAGDAGYREQERRREVHQDQLRSGKVREGLVGEPQREQTHALRRWYRAQVQIEARKDQRVRSTRAVGITKHGEEYELYQCRKHAH